MKPNATAHSLGSRISAVLVFLSLSLFGLSVASAGDAWTTQPILADFYAEGAGVGDINGDGNADLAYGPFWFAGPDFETKTRFADGEPFDGGAGYSDNFFSFVRDFNKDGKNDILVFGFPGKSARLYLNSDAERWEMIEVADQVANESPHLIDLIPGGHPEIVCARAHTYGYYEAGDDATKPWTWHTISGEKEAATPFGHGLGVGDINGDGRDDVVEKMHWYEHPENPGEGLWKKHRWALVPYGGGGAQILVDDVDGDGDNDLITSLNAHGYGIAWFEQDDPGKFARHDIVGQSSTENAFGVAFSQPHAMALVDMDGDGRKDFVTGKRYFAHKGRDPGGLQEAVLYWFRNREVEDGIEFEPHLVHRDSGVGVEVKVADLNADGKPDIVTSSKKGLIVHRQTGAASVVKPERWKLREGRSQEGYGTGMTPQQALARMEVPEGFSVDLIAAEPDIKQPIAMCFDARGRIWVIEGHTYPERAPDGEGKDRILIFEDKDGDGTMETRKVFAEGLNLASGLEVGFGGVYVGAAPNLLFFPDHDQNDKPDGEPEILLDGWGYQDTHETLNSFTWGPDGWLYGCHGVFTHSRVGKPGEADESRIPLNAGLWRFHPVSKEFQVFAHGTSNPWGADFDELGNWFISACVIPHFYHLTQGGRYQRQGGQHFNPWTFDDLKTIADHAHYAGNIRDHAFWGDNKSKRPSAPTDTSALGGGHAHCGLALYLADTFPPAYRGDAFFHNLHGHRLVRESLEANGSGHVARHRPDFFFANDHDFVGVGVMLGPDGALYLSDWVDPQTCHHRDVEIWDRSNGRIYRIRYGESRSPRLDLPERSDGELVAMLGNGNAFLARQAQRLLQERSAAKSLNREETLRALEEFETTSADQTHLRLRAFWTRHVTGLATEQYVAERLEDADEHVRGWAVQLAEENERTISRFESMAGSDSSLVVRKNLASRLQRLPLNQRWKIAEHLITHPQSGFDPNIPLLCWYGIEPLMEIDSTRTLALGNRTRWPQLKDFLARRGAITPEGRESILTALAKERNPDTYLKKANELLGALAKLPPVDPPRAWNLARSQGEAIGKGKPVLQDAISRLGVRFGDADFFPKWRTIATDGKRQPAIRTKAIELLEAGRDPEIGALARSLLDQPPVRSAALSALRQAPGPETAKSLVQKLGGFSLQQRNEAVNLLASRPEMALPLLQAVDEERIPSSLVSPVLLDQFERFGNEQIDALVEKNWSRNGSAVDLAQLHGAIEGWKKKLNPKVLAKADPSRGRQVYAITCGTCHQLYGEGIALGPDLTGSNRADLGYLLENVLAPSVVLAKEYALNVFTMKDGAAISGMIQSETPEFFQVSLPGGAAVDVKKSEVKERQELSQSLMPAGLFDAMPLEQVADLVKYLVSPRQVPLPGDAGKTVTNGGPAAIPAPAKGVTRIEAESFVGVSQPTGGRAQNQGMKAFKGGSWSGGHQLFWVGAQPGDVLSLRLPDVSPGTKDLTLFPTTARDYGIIKVTVNGQLQEVDLYTPQVLTGEPIRFRKVNVSPKEGLQVDIHVIGKNEAALPRFMVGLDRIEVQDSAEPK